MVHTLARDFGGTGSSRVLILLCAALVLALPLSITARAERLPVKIYTSADGLGSSFVNYILRDSRGFMWFCTRDGLSRFDGNRFVTYSIGDRDSPPGIESITETRDGTYWIGTTGGLYRFKRDAFSQPDATNASRPRLNAEFISNSRGLLLEDREGVLWYGAGSLNRLEEKDGKVSSSRVALNLPVPPDRRSGIVRMIEADDGSLWIDTSAGLVRREVFLIFKESVNNNVKHSGCTRAEITFQIEDDWLVLKVSDNGKGFDGPPLDGGEPALTTASGSNGILSMRRRPQEMGGELEIVSAPGQGTSATLRLLIAQQQVEGR
ncbi:MAG TPA: ATP-binding protein [Blastocatellia bacterium]|nr:ATP-binding protein [Blastocatellia bacterium]